MMKKVLPIFVGCLLVHFAYSQTHYDFIGAGHLAGISVTTSDEASPERAGLKTIDGFPVEDAVLLSDASRFLAQATLGYDYETIQMAAAMGYEAWMDEQFTLPRTGGVGVLEEMMEALTEEEVFGSFLTRPGWWELVLKQPDALNQRVIHAFSQLFVISYLGNDIFEDNGNLIATYHELLGQHSFGNYRELLLGISRHLGMGLYLSHLNNPKSDPANNIHPDENYAREIMQLFSIGLYELNNDGTRKLDAQGQFIPTYNNDDIREFAKVFTGLGDGQPGGQWGSTEDIFQGGSLYPMAMYEEWHEPGPKYLLNGQVVPAGQTGLQDVEAAIDNLHQHPNVGPFIGKALIQFLVSSNPSPAYVNRVATAFNSGGSQRGDFRAILKAILLDEEARVCQPTAQPQGGKLREPIVRYTNFLRAFNARPELGFYLDEMYDWGSSTNQIPYFANSVFNFYQPEFQPNGPIADQDWVAPVFQIHNSSTAIGYINQANLWTVSEAPQEDGIVLLDYEDELALSDQPSALVDRLNILLACGQLSPASRSIIFDAISQLGDPNERLNLALYLIQIAPEYAILK
ncbi:MAG: DUF1800 family protein [Bacteroidota bacterium]